MKNTPIKSAWIIPVRPFFVVILLTLAPVPQLIQIMHSMKKISTLISVVLACATTAFAAHSKPGKVVKVGTNTITLHWVADTRKASDYTYKITPQTTYWQGGRQVALSNIQKGVTVEVTSEHGVASRIDIMYGGW